MTFVEHLKNQKTYPGYPEIATRNIVSLQGYENWVRLGRPSGLATEVYDHPNYLKGLSKGLAVEDDRRRLFLEDEFMPSFTGAYARDMRGRPLHPYAKDMLLAGLGLEGPGAYWTYGPTLSADPIPLGMSRDGKLKTIVIERLDTGAIALAGGWREVGEKPVETALRELCEETTRVEIKQGVVIKQGVEIKKDDLLFTKCVYEGVVPDSRTTLNAWPETSAFVFVLRDGVIDNYSPAGADDAKEAFCAVVNQRLYDQMNHPSHGDFIRKGVRVYETVTNRHIAPGGYVLA